MIKQHTSAKVPQKQEVFLVIYRLLSVDICFHFHDAYVCGVCLCASIFCLYYSLCSCVTVFVFLMGSKCMHVALYLLLEFMWLKHILSGVAGCGFY